MTLNELKEALDKVCLNNYNGGFYDIDDLPEEIYSRLTVVEKGQWTQDYKYQNKDTIIKDDEGNHFMLSNNRSGSAFSDWEYGEPDIFQVVPKVVSTTVWEHVG